MKYKLAFLVFAGFILHNCTSQPEPAEYFVRPCEFVCDYPFNDTTKWAITCRVWGLLKYYHPNVTAGKLDWDQVLFDGVEKIHFSITPEDANLELKKMLDVAGEYEYEKGEKLNDSLKMNVNLCWLDNSFLDDALRDELRKIASLKVRDSAYYTIDFADKKLPNEKAYNLEIASYMTSLKYRLLFLFRYWNVIYYYSPHKYLMDQSWDKTLSEFIFPFIEATDRQSYRTAFLKLAERLNDGHGFVSFAKSYQRSSQNIIEKVDGKTVVKIDAGGLQKGDAINRIGTSSIEHIRDSLAALISASTQGNKEYRINCFVAEMIFLRETDVSISRDDRELAIHMTPVSIEKDSSIYKWISDDVGYVDLSKLIVEEIDPIFQTFSNTKAIIFDLRENLNCETSRLTHYLYGKELAYYPPVVLPDLEHPGAFVWYKATQIPEDNSGSPLFKGKIVYLINENSQSATELEAFVGRANYNATLVGRHTSGALARITLIPLDGYHRAGFSNFALFSLDKEDLQRKGIIPDIEVYPTMESIKAGKDEILEAAIEYLNNF